ncbi:MAG TPA: NAD(P)/FAD-dependent oxidoreductase [Mycobacteriales bacterium]|nr:NAD(P)/FAD-dependent oxidoreductase [Mycobacteriales bacterium]
MSEPDLDAVVVGSGPNGLAAAVTLAQAGRSVVVLEAADTIGGGTRSAELTVPGLIHDVCSAGHPFGAGSPYLATLPLDEHGLKWRWAEIEMAHPLDDGPPGTLCRSITDTAASLGEDGAAWRRTFGPLSEQFGSLAVDFFGPLLHVPRHPVVFTRFGLRALWPATTYAKRFSTPQARALFASAAAHSYTPLTWPGTAGVADMFIAAGHSVGWPVAEGGSQAIANALASLLTSLGGRIETGIEVKDLASLPPSRVRLFDTSPGVLAAIAGEALPARVRRAYARFRRGPAAFKVDLAVEGGIPWRDEACARAATVHLGGAIEELTAAEAQVYAGTMPERPFVLLMQQYLADPSRSSGDVHPIWAYAHVPNGYPHDATEVVLDQIERFAPGARERIVGRHVMGPAALESYNASYAGGDIIGGANTLRQIVFRPRVSTNPYATGIPGTYLCSASTPPGGGVHGMCGHHAARHAVRYLDGR